jgi:hypothetical protein
LVILGAININTIKPIPEEIGLINVNVLHSNLPLGFRISTQPSRIDFERLLNLVTHAFAGPGLSYGLEA